jgi:hypothetical protein
VHSGILKVVSVDYEKELRAYPKMYNEHAESWHIDLAAVGRWVLSRISSRALRTPLVLYVCNSRGWNLGSSVPQVSTQFL